MIARETVFELQSEAAEMFRAAGIVITDAERQQIEIADFGLSDFANTGLAVLVYVNTKRCCAKELAMWPRQTCPQHRHPDLAAEPGKEETFRCRRGTVYLYVPGPATASSQAKPPQNRESNYTVWHEIELQPGDQYTIPPNTEHWFQAGENGAVVSEFSTRSTDEYDIFVDPDINRFTQIT